MTKKAKIICKTCGKSAIIHLRNKEEQECFAWLREGRANLNCSPCAYKFWHPKIVNGEVDLERKSPEFRRNYQEMKKSCIK